MPLVQWKASPVAPVEKSPTTDPRPLSPVAEVALAPGPSIERNAKAFSSEPPGRTGRRSSLDTALYNDGPDELPAEGARGPARLQPESANAASRDVHWALDFVAMFKGW